MSDTSKINEILNYYGLKTNIEETKKWVKKYIGDALTGITTSLMTNGTYEQIKGWRDNNNLKPGMLYRMTDYVTKVYSEDGSISSAEHPFDLILFADSNNALNKNVLATLHNGDEYFSNSKLSAWEIKYSIDNDNERFDYGADGNVKQIYTDDNLWFTYVGTRKNVEDKSQTLYLWYNENFDAEGSGVNEYLFTYNRNPEVENNNIAGTLNEIYEDGTVVIGDDDYSIVTNLKSSESGFGIIYYMKDEFNNEAPYDFKNILQNDGDYTFGKLDEDYSLNGYVNGVYNNKILPQVDAETGKHTINKIRVTEKDCRSNLSKSTCVNSYINFTISECDISMNDDGELVVFKTQDFVSGIENKPIEEHNYKNDYLTFEAVNDDTEIIFKTYTDDPQYTKTIEVSKDKVNWETKTSSSEGVILASLNASEKLYLRGNNSSYAYFDENEGKHLPNFILPLNYCYVYGNVMSLIDSNNFRTLTEITDGNAFFALFYDYWNENYSGEYVLSHHNKKLELPATTLADSCYYDMFYNCTSLTTAPALPATTLTDSCYQSMFQGCSNLNYIKCLATNISASNCTTNWVSGVANSGLFEKNPDATWPIGSNGIPSGWTTISTANIIPYNPTTTFNPVGSIEFEAQSNSTLFGIFKKSTNQSLYISKDNSNWMELTESCLIELSSGEAIYACGKLTGNNSNSNYTQFAIFGDVVASGNINSIWNYEDLSQPLKQYCGYYLFRDCKGLDNSGLTLPATALTPYCYESMFYGCTSLTKAPVLPATTLNMRCYTFMFKGCSSLMEAPELPATALTQSCYTNMFNGCTSLVEAPELPTTTLAVRCYFQMFYGCTSLTEAPELPATTLAERCYQGMFEGCSSLTEAPELPATTLAERCYLGMFEGCSSLNYIKCLATNISASYCTNSWVNGVASTGTFVKNANMTGWTTGDSGIPTNWTVQDAS